MACLWETPMKIATPKNQNNHGWNALKGNQVGRDLHPVLPEFHAISRSIFPDFAHLTRQQCFKNPNNEILPRQDDSSAGSLTTAPPPRLEMRCFCFPCRPAAPQVVAPGVGERHVEQQVTSASIKGCIENETGLSLKLTGHNLSEYSAKKHPFLKFAIYPTHIRALVIGDRHHCEYAKLWLCCNKMLNWPKPKWPN